MQFSALPWSLQALIYASIATADSLPYTPTRLLRTTNSSNVYLLQSSTQSPNQGILRVINVAQDFTTDSLSLKTLSSSLPFLSDNGPIPYTPVIDASGNITVISGSCTAGADKTQVWRYAPENDSGTGSWKLHQTSDQQLAPGSNLTGSNYLAGAVSFSSEVGDDETGTGYYLFGGMCPFSASDASTWTSDAAYSNTMLQLQPDPAPNGEIAYDISSIAGRLPAIPEAGFSMTALSPTYSVNASGRATSQQQDFLLLGGHTQQAFINMSNIALFSLPQESWAFVPVQQPTTAEADLATRANAAVEVEPRSGHTAVLSEDGTSIIVLGGWVGNVSHAAEPQLAVLHLGSEYGGDASEQWTWTVPEPQGSIVTAGNGIYGHGATMLPGGVMMVAGGYTISPAGARKRTTQDNVFLYNTTSNTWIDSYYPPATFTPTADSRTAGALSKTSQQAGLGVGLGIGALVLAGAVCVYLWYSRRLRRQHEAHRRALLTHSSDGSFIQLDQPYTEQDGGIDGRGGDMFAGHQPTPEMSQPVSSGLFANIPSPTRGLRKGLSTRPYQYHAAPRYDDNRANRGSGHIHPILERADEDDSVRGDDDAVQESDAVQRLKRVQAVFQSHPEEPQRNLRELQRVLRSPDRSPGRPISNPFADPVPNPLGSHPNSPEKHCAGDTVRRVPTGASRLDRSPTRRPLSAEIDGSMNWMLIDAPDDAPHQANSSSGTEEDRTSSTLSERSQQSHTSSTSITRTLSTRTGAIMAAALAARSKNGSPEAMQRPSLEQRTNTMGTMSSSSGTRSPSPFYTLDLHQGKRRGSTHAAQKSADSFRTARSTFAVLQDQGAALLGGRPMTDRDDPYQRARAATTSGGARETSMSENRPPPLTVIPPRRRQGWMGSLRRALTAISNNDRSLSFTGSAGTDPYEDSPVAADPRTSSSSPTRPGKNVPAPRRAASDGGALLRQKRGQEDWAQELLLPFEPYADDPDPGDWGAPRDEQAAEREWDVEGEASKRDVQVMFTVPKARLRVVNVDVERASLRSASDGAVSRGGSVRRGESVRTVRSVSDGEGGASSGREV